mmetsp:Transcript_17928/g.40237  ORF Transcript_17928/g.40237 Transcript_17928/m.40237 type:complete len:80 (-) Transcript_17928:74-313(-)
MLSCYHKLTDIAQLQRVTTQACHCFIIASLSIAQDLLLSSTCASGLLGLLRSVHTSKTASERTEAGSNNYSPRAEAHAS